MVGQCKLCLKQAKLVKSHIIPESFYGQDNFLISEESQYPKRRPIGVYSYILCNDCEGGLNTNFDNDAKKILIDRKDVFADIISSCQNAANKIKVYRLLNKNHYDLIAKFFVSIIWRASVSSEGDFSSFSLGRYEEIAKQVILNPSKPMDQSFAVSLCCISDFTQPIQLVSHKLVKISGVNFYSIIVGSIKAFIKCDKRPVPQGMSSSVLDCNNDILMFEDDIKNFPEHKMLLSAAENYRKFKSK